MIEIKNVSKIYQIGKHKSFKALDQINLEIQRGEILGLVGPSGSGKSTLGKMILGLIEPTEGEIIFEGRKKVELMPRKIQMVFQDPYSSLNPRMTIEAIITEPTKIHGLPSRVDELLAQVGLPKEIKRRYPHELSGGQRQRIGIARALALNPEVLICDEPISALDVSIQAQIINLLLRLKNELQLTVLFISHDLPMVRHVSNRVVIMHRGKILDPTKLSDTPSANLMSLSEFLGLIEQGHLKLDRSNLQ